MLINTKQREHFSRGLLGTLQVAPPFLHSQQFLLANAYFLSELGSCEQPPADNSAATPHHSHWHQPPTSKADQDQEMQAQVHD
jgi:hypothetical protein